ncbi:MAG: RNA-binding protein [Simkaniaceae bacterium]|nr:RNA-binding protein [Simkaniaceae bacterium]
MAKKLFVGNLPHAVTDSQLKTIFEEHGAVASARVIMDRDSGRSKGFGFVEYDDDNAAQSAIRAMNGKEVDGRPLTVNEARPRENTGAPRGGSGGARPPRGNSNGNSNRRY